MLTVITEKDGEDYVADFLQSPEYQTMKSCIHRTIEEEGQDTDKKIVYSTEFAAARRMRITLLVRRTPRANTKTCPGPFLRKQY